jgi:ubiquinone/menaquinone biosynthesis C-methylase UbiE
MTEYVLTAKNPARAGSFYDRIARYYNLTFKVNGYGRALDQYFATHPLPLTPGARILDAGCGTGLLTLAVMRSMNVSASLTAIDLSASSITTAQKAVAENRRRRRPVQFAQSNILSLPFTDDAFDLVVTSGVLEYVPLEEGFRELARVIAPGGHILNFPIRPSFASSFLELLFRFKAHSPSAVAENTERHFRVVDHYRFPKQQVIGWTKSAVLAQKV